MSTPSQSHSQPQKPPPAVSTPTPSFPHPSFSSPASRSVASPAAHRTTHPAGKSPFPNPTSTPTATSAYKADTPGLKAETPQSALKQPLNSATVARDKLNAGLGAAMGSPADFASASPAALQLSLSSQGMHPDGSNGVSGGGVGMGLSISGLGMSGLGLSNLGMGIGMGIGSGSGAGGARLLDDEERRRRLESVIAALGTRHGRVSQEGVERVCRENGWEVLWEERKGGGRRLMGAGTNALVDVDFVGKDGVEKVAVTVHEAGEGVKGTMDQAGRVLLRDLNAGPSSLDRKLGRFAANLARLARLDKLSRTQEGLNCYDAVSGVYTSLQRLYEHQFKVAAELFKEKADAVSRAEREVMCRKSGKPRMHGKRTVGLSVDYWQSRKDEEYSRASGHTAKEQHSSAMDIDQPKDSAVNDEEGDAGLFSINLEIEPCPAALYPSIRTSNHWISDTVEKQPEDNSTDLDGLPDIIPNELVVDWQEPALTYLSTISTGVAGENSDAMALDAATGGLGKLPDVRFIAKLNPPVTLPLPLALQIMNQVGMSVPQETIRATDFHSIVIQRPNSSIHDTAPGIDESKAFTAEKTITVSSDVNAQQSEIRHQYILGISTPIVYGRLLEEIPFSHPRQIIALLPTFRQYAFLGSLLQSAFAGIQTLAQPSHGIHGVNGKPKIPPDDLDFITDFTTHDEGPAPFSVNIQLELTLLPSISVQFAMVGKHDAKVTVNILPNAEVSVTEQNLLLEPPEASIDEASQDAEYRRLQQVQGIARALEASGDLGIWVEWMKGRFAERMVQGRSSD
ncbi:MAG: hypothetical protein M1821_007247 [Bathelium mastoideum]|nr:MAG: hypothetical protein M1821_007247 [Bathelium mastoideum]